MSGSKEMHVRSQRENCQTSEETGVWEEGKRLDGAALKQIDEQAWLLIGSGAQPSAR